MHTKLNIRPSKEKVRVYLNLQHELCYNLEGFEQEHLPRSEYYSRFDSLFIADNKTMGSYFRSDKKKLKDTQVQEASFLGNQEEKKSRMYPKTGNFYNPFHFKAYKNAVKPLEEDYKPVITASWYDFLLNYQKCMAEYIISKVNNLDENILLNADYRYPCVLLSLPKPPAEKNDSTWTDLMGVYLIAIVNKLAYERGINIEIHRRSSFDHIRPSVAECGESLRISSGFIPKDYADCIADGILYLHKLVAKENDFKIPFSPRPLTATLRKYNQIHNKNIRLEESFWDTLWAAGDAKNCSFASQIFRKPVVVEYLINCIMDKCLEKNMEDIFNCKKLFQANFVSPLMDLFGNYTLNKKSLSLNAPKKLKTYQWHFENKIKDTYFWTVVEVYALHLGAKANEVKLIVEQKTTTSLLVFFEYLLKEFFFCPKNFNDVDDGCGSSSEEESTLNLESGQLQVYAKKMVTATGMRAIQIAYAAGKDYLFHTHRIAPCNISFSANLMYYETGEALKKFPIPLNIDNETGCRKQQHIAFFDLNHCNKSQKQVKNLLSEINLGDKYCVVDITSATTMEMHNILKKLFNDKPQLELIIFVSSGLKNEQGMSDYNPYGTVRIFSKTAESLDLVYNCLLFSENEAAYSHPKISHVLRKTAKYYGMAPVNAAILTATPPSNGSGT